MTHHVSPQQLKPAPKLLVDTVHQDEGAEVGVLRPLAGVVDPAASPLALQDGAGGGVAAVPGALADIEAGEAVAAEAGVCQLLVRG